MVGNKKGFMIPNVTTITLFLAVAGFWYLHKAYTNGELKSDLKNMAADGQKAVAPYLSSHKQNANLLNSNNITGESELLQKLFRKLPKQNISPLNTVAPVPASGAYYE
ncbi:hypothetical protein [Geomonas subterranea]|uniref:hypothetical protein n=1 Tax=Geomonas subterranea TaxID=2847989 RepID=UPI001CD4F1DC|nr:hypothetical protein [Geomonas fuzhouensis]